MSTQIDHEDTSSFRIRRSILTTNGIASEIDLNVKRHLDEIDRLLGKPVLRTGAAPGKPTPKPGGKPGHLTKSRNRLADSIRGSRAYFSYASSGLVGWDIGFDTLGCSLPDRAQPVLQLGPFGETFAETGWRRHAMGRR
jgi:hypothetical protein